MCIRDRGQLRQQENHEFADFANQVSSAHCRQAKIVVCHENLASALSIFYLELNPADDCDYLPISCFSKPLSMILHDGARGPWRWRIPPPKPASAGIHRTVGDGSGELGLPPADYGVWGRRKLP